MLKSNLMESADQRGLGERQVCTCMLVKYVSGREVHALIIFSKGTMTQKRLTFPVLETEN